jgi:hypothetical protein
MKINVNAFQHRIINESVSNVSELLWFNFFCLVFVLCFKHKFKCFLLFGDTYFQMFVLFLYLTIKKKIILFPVFLSLFLSFFAHLLVNLYCLRCAIFFFPLYIINLSYYYLLCLLYCLFWTKVSKLLFCWSFLFFVHSTNSFFFYLSLLQ